jgi:predicted RNA-binding protein with PUA-like domain
MQYWLMKSEPSAYSWSQLVKDKRTGWSGVRNYLANNNMKAMKIGDQAFFYHSNQGLEIVGLMKIVGLWHPDPSDKTGKFGMVDVAPVKTLKHSVTLGVIKENPLLTKMVFVRQGRLSVSPVSAAEWREILKLSEAA